MCRCSRETPTVLPAGFKEGFAEKIMLELRWGKKMCLKKEENIRLWRAQEYHISQMRLLISKEFTLTKWRIDHKDTDTFHGIQWKTEHPGLHKSWNLPPGTQLQKFTNLDIKALELKWLNSQQPILVSLSLNAKENQIGPVLVKSAFLAQPAMTRAKLVIFICQDAQKIEITGSVDRLKIVYFSHIITQGWGQKIMVNCIRNALGCR